MDPLMSRAQKQVKGSSSKASSKGTSRKGRKNKNKKKKEKTQNAGQPSGVSSSERSRSRAAVSPAEEATPTRSQSSGGGDDLGTKIAGCMAGALHVIDGGLGIALLAYGGMVHVTSVTAAAVTYGLVLLLGAVAGAIGYYTGGCNRRGLAASAIAGFILCLVDISLFVAALATWPTFIQFLSDNKEALMLTDDSVKTIEGLEIFFAALFVVLGGLEVHRGMVMWRLNDIMPGGGSSNRSSGGSKCDILSWFGLSKKKKTDDFVVFDDSASMESALLWSKNGSQPTSDDYLEFVPEHERGLADFHSNVPLPTPPDDEIDY